MPNIFEYLDYRKYLLDSYQERKKTDPWFTHRHIAEHLSIDSGLVTKILNQERHLSLSSVEKYGSLLKLGKKEAAYLRNLVMFCKAKRHTEKNERFQVLLAAAKTDKQLFTRNQYALFDKWYNLVIWELVTFVPFNEDFGLLGKMVVPHLTPAMAKKSVRLLEKMGLIERTASGLYVKLAPVWSTGEEARSVAVVNFQKSMLDIAKDAYDRFRIDERYMSTLTVSLSKKEYEGIQAEIKALRDRILAAAVSCADTDRVCQCGIFLFPVSRIKKGEGLIHE